MQTLKHAVYTLLFVLYVVWIVWIYRRVWRHEIPPYDPTSDPRSTTYKKTGGRK